MKRLGTAILLLLLVALPMFAQGQGFQGQGFFQGQGVGNRRELVRAEYGWGNNWVDVTERVQSLIRNQSLNFRADNDTLGFDPSPGEDKALRLYLRNRQGRTQMLTFEENANVRLRRVYSTAVSSSGSLQILRATYGYGNQSFDVTSRLQRQIRNGQLNLRVTNQTMGGDPAVDRDKTLTVLHSFNGRRGRVVVNEGDYLRLPDTVAGDYQGGLQILRATYGYGNRSFDVTDRLQRQIRNGQLNLRVTNETMGGDPAVDRQKILTVQHSYNGRTSQVVVNEGDYLRLPDTQASYEDSSSLQILRATYGSASQSIDVTNRLQRQVSNGRLDLRVTNSTMGGDPAVDGHNHLTVRYSFNGRTNQVVVTEGDYLRLPDTQTSYEDSSLQILRATYGYGNRSFDVTDRLQRQIRNGQLNLQVTNETMGGDPAVDRQKILTVQHSYNGRTGQVVVNEGDYLRLPGTQTSYDDSSSLQILRATYGYGNRSFDVTDRLQRQIRNGQLNLRVTNETMGGDPAVDRQKILTVQHSYNGRTSQVVVNEGDYLRLPDTQTSYEDSSLQILRATYGYGNRSFDVTDRLQRQIRNGQLNLRVTNETMGGDPAVDRDKVLTVQHSYNGRRSEVVVREGEYLRLPDSSIGYQGSSTIIPRGTELKIRTNERIDSKEATAGQTFSATLEEDVRDASSNVAIQRRSDVALVIRNTSGNDLVLDIDSLTVGGERYYVSTEDVERGGGSSKRKAAVMIGGGAVAGAIIGAIVGGGKGAAIGAGVGAGAGAVGTVLTGGKEVRVPAETVLTFRLDQDLRL